MTRIICRAIEIRDSYTAEHQKRVAELASLVGQRLGLNSNNINELYMGGMLHDIGKIGVPVGILTKTSPLTSTEFMLIKDHVRIGYNIIKDTKLPWNIADIVYNHHEKLDGSGYPSGITGDQISMNVRIITVCDVVEAMSTVRPYRKPRTRTEVVDELITNKGIKYDADVVDIMVELIDSEVFNPWRNYSSDLNYSDPDFPDILVR